MRIPKDEWIRRRNEALKGWNPGGWHKVVTLGQFIACDYAIALVCEHTCAPNDRWLDIFAEAEKHGLDKPLSEVLEGITCEQCGRQTGIRIVWKGVPSGFEDYHLKQAKE